MDTDGSNQRNITNHPAWSPVLLKKRGIVSPLREAAKKEIREGLEQGNRLPDRLMRELEEVICCLKRVT